MAGVVKGSQTNYVTMSGTAIYPATSTLAGALPGQSPTGNAGILLAGIFIRKNPGVKASVQLQALYYSSLLSAYVDMIPVSVIGTTVGWLDFYHMPDNVGSGAVRQLKSITSGCSLVIWKR
jgi:hypothetical protein